MKKLRYAIGKNEFYEIASYNVNNIFKLISVETTHLIIDGINSVIKRKIFNINNYVPPDASYEIDSNWTAKSSPPRPDGITLKDPDTWNGLSWDDIPKTIPEICHFDNFINKVKTGMSNEEALFEILVSKKDLSGGEILEVDDVE